MTASDRWVCSFIVVRTRDRDHFDTIVLGSRWSDVQSACSSIKLVYLQA